MKNHDKICWIKNKKFISFLIVDGSVDKKQKAEKACAMKRKLKFENYKNCLEATQLDNKIRYLQNDKINIEDL